MRVVSVFSSKSGQESPNMSNYPFKSNTAEHKYCVHICDDFEHNTLLIWVSLYISTNKNRKPGIYAVIILKRAWTRSVMADDMLHVLFQETIKSDFRRAAVFLLFSICHIWHKLKNILVSLDDYLCERGVMTAAASEHIIMQQKVLDEMNDFFFLFGDYHHDNWLQHRQCFSVLEPACAAELLFVADCIAKPARWSRQDVWCSVVVISPQRHDQSASSL